MGRSILAVVAGFAATTVLVLLADWVIQTAIPGAFPHPDTGRSPSTGWIAAILGYSFVFGVVGGWVAARLAAAKPVAHALALGLVAMAVGIAVMASTWGRQPIWYQILVPVIPVPAAWLGGVWRARQLAPA